MTYARLHSMIKDWRMMKSTLTAYFLQLPRPHEVKAWVTLPLTQPSLLLPHLSSQALFIHSLTT